MGREAHRGVELGAPETLWDPHFCSASCSIAMATSQPQPLSQTSPACPPPGPALSSAEAEKSLSDSRMGQEGGGSSAGWALTILSALGLAYSICKMEGPEGEAFGEQASLLQSGLAELAAS